MENCFEGPVLLFIAATLPYLYSNPYCGKVSNPFRILGRTLLAHVTPRPSARDLGLYLWCHHRGTAYKQPSPSLFDYLMHIHQRALDDLVMTMRIHGALGASRQEHVFLFFYSLESEKETRKTMKKMRVKSVYTREAIPIHSFVRSAKATTKVGRRMYERRQKNK